MQVAFLTGGDGMKQDCCIPIGAFAAILTLGVISADGGAGGNGVDRAFAKPIQWSLLAPNGGKPFNDPFSRLTRDQLAQVGYVVRVQTQVAQEKASADGIDAIKAAELSRQLKQQGVDIPWLVGQLDSVRKMRGRSVDSLAQSIVESFNGRNVTLTGYVIPITVNKGRLTEFFLVPSVAACSHEAAPPRLQVVFVQSHGDILRPDKSVPVRVTGNIEARTRTAMLLNASGQTPIRSAYWIKSARVETHHPSQN